MRARQGAPPLAFQLTHVRHSHRKVYRKEKRDGNLHGFFSLVTSHRADRHCSNSTHTLGVPVHFILPTVIKERDTCENNDSESNI